MFIKLVYNRQRQARTTKKLLVLKVTQIFFSQSDEIVFKKTEIYFSRNQIKKSEKQVLEMLERSKLALSLTSIKTNFSVLI